MLDQDITRRKAAEAERAAEHARQRASSGTDADCIVPVAQRATISPWSSSTPPPTGYKGMPEFLGRTATCGFTPTAGYPDCFRTRLVQQGIVRLGI